jgi:hypothetical protein
MGYQPSKLFTGLQTEHFLSNKFLPKRPQPTATRRKTNRISITDEVALKANICLIWRNRIPPRKKITDVSKQTSPAGGDAFTIWENANSSSINDYLAYKNTQRKFVPPLPPQCKCSHRHGFLNKKAVGLAHTKDSRKRWKPR